MTALTYLNYLEGLPDNQILFKSREDLAKLLEAYAKVVEVYKKPVIIECPECNTIQGALVEQTFPFLTCIHTCEFCGGVIMESDWKEIKPYKTR